MELIRKAGADVLILPAYSLDLNPIEKMWSKINSLLRSIEAQTIDDLLAAIGLALSKITQKDVLGWVISFGDSFCKPL